MDNPYKKFAQFLLNEDFKDCVMAEIPVENDVSSEDPYPILPQILSFIETIPDDILYTEEKDHGKETWPHITMLYGLEDDQSEEVKELLKGMEGKIQATLGKVTKFRNEVFDVLKIEVNSPDLTKINVILKTLPNKNTYPTYIPHVTLAYVKPGEGEEFVGDDTFEGIVVSIDKIVYADKNRNHKKVLGENSGWGGGGAGYGGAVGGSISAAGWAGTFNGTRQNINKFGKSSRHTSHDIENSPVTGTEGSRSMPQSGNIVLGWAPYDSIKAEDLNVPGMDKDELYLGIKTELSKQVKPDKNQAKQIAIDNIGLEPKFYSGLKMYMPEQKITHEQKIKAVGDIIKELQTQRNGISSAVNNPANQMIQSAIKERVAGRSIESISEIMRDMYKTEMEKPKKTLKDIK